jgi:DNA-binding NarL/FixJ family response regulator
VDVLLAPVIAFTQVAGTIAYSQDEPPSPWAFDAFAFVLLVAGPVALLFRRRWPEATLVVAFAAAAGYAASGYPRGPAGLPAFGFAVVSAIMMGRRALAWCVLVVAYPAFVGLPYVLPDEVEKARSLADAALNLAWLPLVGAASEIARSRLERRAERAQVAREEARRRASEERLLIARELHDVLAHNISLINVQSGVALHLLDERPEQARPALQAINEASEEALGELRSVLDVLSCGLGEDGAHGESGAWVPPRPRGRPARPRRLGATDPGGRSRRPVGRRGRGPAGARQGGPGGVPHRAGGAHQRRPPRRRRRPGHGPPGVCARRAARTGRRRRPGRRPGGRRVGRRDDGGQGRGPRHPGHAGAGPRPGRDVGGRPPPRPGLPRPGAVPTAGWGAMIRVLLADDQALVRAGFRALLDAQDDIEVVGEADDGEEAVQLARRHRPDVVLMDIRMPGTDGLAATRTIAADDRLADVRIVILTTFELDEYVFEAIRAGASGFLVKNTKPVELLQAARAVAAGDALLSPSVTRRLIREFAARTREAPRSPALDALTDREREVVALVAEGLTNHEIAERLFVSPLTAKTHVSRAMVKLGARDRIQLVVFAYQSGLVRPGWA